MKKCIVQRAVEVVTEQSPESSELVVPVATVRAAKVPGKLWEDWDELEVEPRIQRKTIVARASALVPDAELPQHFRVLDAEGGEPIPVAVTVPPAPPAKRRVG